MLAIVSIHLAFSREGAGSKVHHGIYAGNGQVIHYGGFCRLFRRRPVEEVLFEDFAGGHEVAVKHHATPAFPG